MIHFLYKVNRREGSTFYLKYKLKYDSYCGNSEYLNCTLVINSIQAGGVDNLVVLFSLGYIIKVLKTINQHNEVSNENKYKLVDATEEEKLDFMNKFNDFLNTTGMFYEPVPQFYRETLTSPWEVKCQVFLAKKVLNEDVSIPSPFTDETDTKTS